MLTVNPTSLPTNSNKLFEELFLYQKNDEILQDSATIDERDSSLDLSKLSLKLSIHTLSSPKRENQEIRDNVYGENTESDVTITKAYPVLNIVNVKPLKMENSSIMAKKFIANSNFNAKYKKKGHGDRRDETGNSEIKGKREVIVSKLSCGHIGLLKIFSNVSMDVLENIQLSIPDLGLINPKGLFINSICLSYSILIFEISIFSVKLDSFLLINFRFASYCYAYFNTFTYYSILSV